jgi:hypothetical protein
MPAILDRAKEAYWRLVDDEMDRFVKEAAQPVAAIYEAARAFPDDRRFVHRIYYQPELQTVFFSVANMNEKRASEWAQAFANLPGIKDVLMTDGDRRPPDFGQEPWIFVKRSSNPMEMLAQAGGWKEGPVTKLMGGPSPLGAALASGLLGAGLGYGAGWLGEKVLPQEHFAPGALRRTGAVAGGLLGALPALWWGSIAHRKSPEGGGWKAWTKGWPFRPGDAAMSGDVGTGEWGSGTGEWGSGTGEFGSGTGEVSLKTAVAAAMALLPGNEAPAYFTKVADFPDFGELTTGLDMVDQIPSIPTSDFNQTVWNDPNTPYGIRATTTGVVNAASMSRGGARMISPLDVARIGIGMGTGLASGLIVGKTLGALAGLRPESQRTLQQAGMWSGVLANVVPMIFG